MKSTFPKFETLTTRVAIPDREALRNGVPIGHGCVVRNPGGTGFGGGAVEAEVLDAHPGDQLRLSTQTGLEIDGSKVKLNGRFIGSILRPTKSPIGVHIGFEPNVYYEAASALIAGIEFLNNTSPQEGARTIELRVRDAEGRTAREQIVLDLPIAPTTGPALIVPESPLQRGLGEVSQMPRRRTQICVLMARMRSGTTALRAALSTHSKVYSLGEIFHNDMIEDRHYFYNYFLQSVQRDPRLSLPSEENRFKIFSEYVSCLKSEFGPAEGDRRVLVLGVNYNSLHCLNSYWQHPFSPPYIFKALRQLDVSIIHLRRDNLLRTLVSEYRARRSNIWHRRGDSEQHATQRTAAIELNLRTLLAELEERHFEIAFMQKCLDRYPRVLNLTYEQVFCPNNEISGATLERCAEFFQVENDFQTRTDYRPTGSPTLREAVSNYEELRQLLSGTRFARFLDDDAAPALSVQEG